MRRHMGIGVLVAASLLVMGMGKQPEKPPLTAQDLELAIQRELPVGSNRNDVSAFLKARGISFSDKYEPENIIRAEITHSTKYYTVPGDPVVLQFWFDREGRLLTHNVRESMGGQ